MTTPPFERAVEAALKVAPGEIPDAGAALIVRAVLEAIKYVDGEDEWDLIEVSTKLRMDAVATIEAYDGMLTNLLNGARG